MRLLTLSYSCPACLEGHYAFQWGGCKTVLPIILVPYIDREHNDFEKLFTYIIFSDSEKNRSNEQNGWG